MTRCTKARAKFCVYAQTPAGKKTKGTYYPNAGVMMKARISFLQAILTPAHRVCIYDIRKARVLDVLSGHRVKDHESMFYARLS